MSRSTQVADHPSSGTLRLAEWLDIVEREYFDEFIAVGGSAVKVAVVPTEAGFAFAAVDSRVTRLHMADRIVHEIARQLDWDGLIGAFLGEVLAYHGIALPADAHDLRIPAIAELNDTPEPLLRAHLDRWIWDAVFHDYAMAQDFRHALVHLCLAQLDPDADPALAGAIREWLRGELRLISSLKRAFIFQKVARHNARHILYSLTHWLARAGRKGLVLLLDSAQFAVARRPLDPDNNALHYSTATVLDGYEVLRQLIDATDDMEHCFVCVAAAPEFLSDDKRGMMAYHALHLRIADEVRDRFRANPLASLVRLDA